MATTIQLKRKYSNSTWDGVLSDGEPLIEKSTNRLYVGDGTSTLSNLSPIGAGNALTANTVTDYINNQAISDIFEADTGGISTKVKSATVANKLNRGSVPSLSATKPAFIQDDGTLGACSTYAGGTAVTLNGVSKSGSTANFYAPESAGTLGQVLLSDGASEPAWSSSLVGIKIGNTNISTDNAGVLLASALSGSSDSLQIVGVNQITDAFLSAVTIQDGDSIQPDTPARLTVSGVVSGGKLMIDSGTHISTVGNISTGVLTIKGLNSSDVSYTSLAIDGQSSLSNFSGENVYISGDGPQINLTLGHDDVTLANNSITYTNTYKNCSTDSSGNFSGATFGIDVSKFIITQIALSYMVLSPLSYRRDVFVFSGGDASSSQTLYCLTNTDSASAITATAVGGNISLKCNTPTWYSKTDISIMISYVSK